MVTSTVRDASLPLIALVDVSVGCVALMLSTVTVAELPANVTVRLLAPTLSQNCRL